MIIYADKDETSVESSLKRPRHVQTVMSSNRPMKYPNEIKVINSFNSAPSTPVTVSVKKVKPKKKEVESVLLPNKLAFKEIY